MSIVSLLKTDADFGTDPKKAEDLVKRLLMAHGGSDFFFCPGEKAAFLVDASLPADNESGANFDIRLAWALTHIAIEQGMTDISICLKPEEGFTFRQIIKTTSYGKLAELPGVKLVSLAEAEATPRRTDTGLVLEQAEIYDVLNSADVVISLAKFKTAEGRLFGGALANTVNAARITGDLDYQMKQRALIDIYSTITPDLVIVDCIKGESVFQNNRISCVLAGSDGVALDTVLSAMSGVNMAGNEGLMLATQYGLGISNPSDIAMCGDDMREIMADEAPAPASDKAKKLN